PRWWAVRRGFSRDTNPRPYYPPTGCPTGYRAAFAPARRSQRGRGSSAWLRLGVDGDCDFEFADGHRHTVRPHDLGLSHGRDVEAVAAGGGGPDGKVRDRLTGIDLSAAPFHRTGRDHAALDGRGVVLRRIERPGLAADGRATHLRHVGRAVRAGVTRVEPHMWRGRAIQGGAEHRVGVRRAHRHGPFSSPIKKPGVAGLWRSRSGPPTACAAR